MIPNTAVLVAGIAALRFCPIRSSAVDLSNLVDRLQFRLLLSIPTILGLQELDPFMLCIITSRVKKIRPRIFAIIISRRRITNIRNQVFDNEDVSGSYMTSAYSSKGNLAGDSSFTFYFSLCQFFKNI